LVRIIAVLAEEHVLQIINFPHPTLRRVAKPIRRVDANLRSIVREMFETMYSSKGIGLAANQVDIPLRLFVVNLEAQPGQGEELVFINPVISKPKGTAEAEEGCLSLPGIYANVVRPKQVTINAYSIDGQEITREVTGLLARCVQHELDHLDGVLFTDRLSQSAKADLTDELEELATVYTSKRQTGEIPNDDALAARWAEWEQKYG
jgi:peptide deformylase